MGWSQDTIYQQQVRSNHFLTRPEAISSHTKNAALCLRAILRTGTLFESDLMRKLLICTFDRMSFHAYREVAARIFQLSSLVWEPFVPRCTIAISFWLYMRSRAVSKAKAFPEKYWALDVLDPEHLVRQRTHSYTWTCILLHSWQQVYWC